MVESKSQHASERSDTPAPRTGPSPAADLRPTLVGLDRATGPGLKSPGYDWAERVRAIHWLQRTAGNATVAQLLVQRHPEGAGLSVDAGAINAQTANPPTMAMPKTEDLSAATGTGPAVAPAPAKTMEATAAQDALTKAFGSVHTIVKGNIVLLDDYEATWAKYDEVNQGRVNPYTKQPWKKGDAKTNIPGLGGFQDGGTVYVNLQTPLTTATAHEMLHLNTAAGFRAAVGETVNEGTTEYLALKAVKQAGVAINAAAEAYPLQRAFVQKLIGVVGEEALIQAYFTDANIMINIFEGLQGAGTWKTFRGFAEKLDDAGADPLLKPPSDTQRIAAINGILDSWWVSDQDIENIGLIVRTGDLAEIRKAIRPRILDLTSIGQRTRLRYILNTV